MSKLFDIVKSKVVFFILYALSFLNCKGDEKSYEAIYRSYLSSVEKKIQNTDSDKLFLFFTDTHIPDNVGNTSVLLNDLINHTAFQNVVWGGDAISAFGDNIEAQWDNQVSEFDEIKKAGKLYCLRGNHDFTIKSSDNTGSTFSQKKTAGLIFEQTDRSIVRNTQEETGCYYYFDDNNYKIRYVILDTNDSEAHEDMAWGLSCRVSAQQISWLANDAILTTPQSYSIIILSHIGVTSATNPNCSDFAIVKSLIDAVQSRKAFNSNGVAADFSKLNDGVNILMCLSGHTHQDLQTYSGGVWHITTASDAFYMDYKNALINPPVSKREKKSVTEHVIDCVSFDRINNRIIFNRMGCGANRIFNLTPIKIKSNSSVKLFDKSQCTNFYGIYSAGSEKYSNGWTVSRSNIELTGDGYLNAAGTENAIAYYYSISGDLIFNYVIAE